MRAPAIGVLMGILAAGGAHANPIFQGERAALSQAVKERITGSSWRKGCPLPLDQLAYLTVTHWGYDGEVHKGELLVDVEVADEMLAIFRELFEAKFAIEKMRLVDEYKADDDASMADNNTSAFNCRWVSGKKGVYSKHSYGRAIDINPLTNPFVTKRGVSPPGGKAYLDRTAAKPGLIVAGDACHRAFTKRGWKWGGAWRTMKDYQHFEKKLKKPRRDRKKTTSGTKGGG